MRLEHRHLVLVPVPGTEAGRRIDAGSGIVCAEDAWRRLRFAAGDPLAGPAILSPGELLNARVEVCFEGNRFGAVNLYQFEERVQCASGRLATKYPTVARGWFHPTDFDVVGVYSFSSNFKQHLLEILPNTVMKAWVALKPAIFKQKVPCQDCPFRREGGKRNGPVMMKSYIQHFLVPPGATFPCHKSVPSSDPRDKWSEWQDGQVLCSGGLIFAAKHGIENGAVAVGVANGWYDPAKHLNTPEAEMVFDTIEEMLEAT